ncbi:uncharacterized protein UV8b_03329 [Ustilaginoidea virens]|uniref:Chitin deacetylase n=1 Tax=Ustilaginoidea virens TaxID=1159556 RepID=A0A8E5HPN1_USTVR|nr:uncharacterized protein UV8b_03329 [Ustilaginoidea virens]QUC19088.1 hypothetical protein UV8b_03329 [Ustilaginoidea virens]
MLGWWRLSVAAALGAEAVAAAASHVPLAVTLVMFRRQSVCGPGEGSCDAGSCCSESGYCGSTVEYCGGSQCQLDYSHTCDTLVPPAGGDTGDILRPRAGNVPYGGPLITSCKAPGMVALSFDDGPYTYTNELLDQLQSTGVKATFFVTGNNLGKGPIDDPSTAWPGILRRMYREGHQIASHSWTHRDLNQINDTVRRAELVYNEMALRNIFGFVPTYFRPPFLECNAVSGCQDVLGRLAYHSISANLDTKDYMYDDAALIQRAKDRFSQGLSANAAEASYIVLAHDSHEQTVRNLTSFMIEVAEKRGYKLVTVGECLGDARENWYRPAAGGNSYSSRSCRDRTQTQTQKQTQTPTSAWPRTTSRVSVSVEGRCGGRRGHTCAGSVFGSCCSHFGYWYAWSNPKLTIEQRRECFVV